MKAEKIARQMDETDLQILQVIIDDFSSVLEFSAKWIRAACEDKDILLCEERLAKFTNFGIIEQDTRRETSGDEAFFFLRNFELAREVLTHANDRTAKS